MKIYFALSYFFLKLHRYGNCAGVAVSMGFQRWICVGSDTCSGLQDSSHTGRRLPAFSVSVSGFRGSLLCHKDYIFAPGFVFFFSFCFVFFLVQHNLEHLKAFQPKCGGKQVRHYFCTKLAFLIVQMNLVPPKMVRGHILTRLI